MFEVLSVREIFFCFFSKFFKIKSGIYKFKLQGDMGTGQGIKINFQIGDLDTGQGINKNFQDREMDGDYCKFLRRGKCTWKNVNNYGRGYD